ncbi:MAG: SDR family oxidoreductase [Vulcanococcus sp.]
MTDQAVKSAPRLLVIGGGYSGQRFARALLDQGATVWLTRRNGIPETPDGEGLHWLSFDASQGLIPALPEQLSHVLVTIPPNGEGRDDALEHLLGDLRRQPLDWLGYLSTTGVYGNSGGDWVDEGSPTTATLPRSQARLRCAQAWLNSGLPVQSFRLPAIYGPGRCPFEQLRQGSARLTHKPGQVFCRIHVDDIVGALMHCIALPPNARPTVVNVSDDAPCPSSETLGFAAHLLNLKLPAYRRFADIAPELSPMALSFWEDNRRVSNRLLCQGLGYPLRYPSYREGFTASLREEQSRSNVA